MITLNRRQSIQTIAAGTAFFSMTQSNSLQAQPANHEYWMFVGTYTSGDEGGIFIQRFNANDGTLESIGNSGGIKNPSFLAISPNHKNLYSVSEVSDFNGQRSGGISSFSIDGKTGQLTPLNQQSTKGQGPCYVTVDDSGKWVLSANYSSGNVCVFPVNEDGSLSPASDVQQHEGSSVNERRQEGPHAHCIVLSPDNRYVFSADLGADEIKCYQFDREHGKLIPQPSVKAAPGAGPRHFKFHPNGKLAFLINELNSTISSYTYDSESGKLTEVQTVSSLPEKFAGNNSCADIHVHPNGMFVYGSNRGHDSIVIYAVDEESGKLTYVGHEPTRGETPRNFAIDPSEEFLLAENQKSGTIHVFRINADTGKLTHTGESAEIPTPVCIKFVPIES